MAEGFLVLRGSVVGQRLRSVISEADPVQLRQFVASGVGEED
jgi:hypothetical protein